MSVAIPARYPSRWWFDHSCIARLWTVHILVPVASRSGLHRWVVWSAVATLHVDEGHWLRCVLSRYSRSQSPCSHTRNMVLAAPIEYLHDSVHPLIITLPKRANLRWNLCSFYTFPVDFISTGNRLWTHRCRGQDTIPILYIQYASSHKRLFLLVDEKHAKPVHQDPRSTKLVKPSSRTT